MDSFNDDIFALSDDDVLMLTPKCNPVEEHLMKQLSDVQHRIEKANSDIEEIQDTTKRVLRSLHYQAQYGEVITSDSDSDLYTIEGEPVIKKQKYRSQEYTQNLVIKNSWKRIVDDKWVIGVTLQNTSTETICKPRFYVDVKGETEIRGTSIFWHLVDETFWCKTNTIAARSSAVATVVLDLPNFEKESFSDAYGTILYEIEKKQYQTPVPTVRLVVNETVDDSCGLIFSINMEHSVLALKSLSVEKEVGIQIDGNDERRVRLFRFLQEKCFKEMSADVYVVTTNGSLLYCLIEIISIIDGEARLRFYSRSASQVNVMLRLLRDEFPDMTIKEDNNCIEAAMALIQELELYLHDGNAPERQRAKIKSDILIP